MSTRPKSSMVMVGLDGIENSEPPPSSTPYYSHDDTAAIMMDDSSSSFDISDVIRNTEQAMNESQQNDQVRVRWLRFVKRIKDMPIWSKVFITLVVLLVTFILLASITNIIFNAVMRGSYAVYFLSSLFLFSGLILIYFAAFAILTQNEYLLFAFLLQSLWGAIMAGFIIYQSITLIVEATAGTTQYDQTIRQYQLLIIFLIIVPASLYYMALICFLIVLIPVYRSFGWKIYRRVGSSPELIRPYRYYSIYKALLQVDIFCLTALFIMAMFWLRFDWVPWSNLGLTVGFLASVLMIPVSIYLGLKMEWYVVQIFVLLFDLTAIPIYMIYKLVEVWQLKESRLTKDPVLDATDLLAILTIITVLALIIRLLLVIFGIICTVHFRRGLKRVFERDMIKIRKRLVFVFCCGKRIDIKPTSDQGGHHGGVENRVVSTQLEELQTELVLQNEEPKFTTTSTEKKKKKKKKK